MIHCYVLMCGRSVTAFLAPPRSQRPGQGPWSPHPKADPAKYSMAFGALILSVLTFCSKAMHRDNLYRFLPRWVKPYGTFDQKLIYSSQSIITCRFSLNFMSLDNFYCQEFPCRIKWNTTKFQVLILSHRQADRKPDKVSAKALVFFYFVMNKKRSILN
jgi:hypothetical protein